MNDTYYDVLIPSKYIKVPSFRRYGFLCLTTTARCTVIGDIHTRHLSTDTIGARDFIPFFLRSGLPFFTVANTRSPAAAAGRRFSRPLIPFTAMI